ncbi:MAG: GrpB family protein [Allosphingosinicella sp.]
MKGGDGKLGLAQGLVRLSEPTPVWNDLFEGEAKRLDRAISSINGMLEHCGSTSIPGIPAKPILDMLLGVPAPVDLRATKDALLPLGYEHAPWAGVPGHEVFGRGNPRTHLIHVVPVYGEAWDRMLRFRDRLREDASLAAEYAQLKRALAARHPDDRATYTDGKSEFVTRVLTQG